MVDVSEKQLHITEDMPLLELGLLIVNVFHSGLPEDSVHVFMPQNSVIPQL
jgi:hypothetical protein